MLSVQFGDFYTVGHRGKLPGVQLCLEQAIKFTGARNRIKRQEKEMNSEPFYS